VVRLVHKALCLVVEDMIPLLKSLAVTNSWCRICSRYERILLACENEKSFTLLRWSLDLYIVKLDKNCPMLFLIAPLFSEEQIILSIFDYLDRSVQAQMREAISWCRFVLFIGGDEYKSGYCNLKNMSTGDQLQFPLNQLDQILTNLKTVLKMYPELFKIGPSPSTALV